MSFAACIADARNIVTVASFLTFIGIVWWAYSARRRDDFAAAANPPFADDERLDNPEASHG